MAPEYTDVCEARIGVSICLKRSDVAWQRVVRESIIDVDRMPDGMTPIVYSEIGTR